MLDVLRAAGRFETFLAAARVSGVEPLLEQPGPFTLFVPTDEAYASQSVGILELPIEGLDSMLLLQVVPGLVPTDRLAGGVILRTIEGETLYVDPTTYGGAPIDGQPRAATNGLVYELSRPVPESTGGAPPATPITTP